ncbi:biliverdin-producing heme oxygenase [Spirosoma taeanense]|uniref:Biliverdin-producing heme oxygenase n=1 Tax=Spirosoma taeanense TaxID=2735870 RepID=A0A6M5Y486_9BACT|nr:biliverdin-producing heme oxygenase [Spirosoma taeanense]QJW88216.1 biliverdin-producing heme oxygenase [Spirosoma taeanense]
MSTLLERLRQETRPLHEQTEQLLYAEALRAGTLTAPEYVHLLRIHLAFHRALEQAIDRYPIFFRDYEAVNRRKAPWLESDLTYLSEAHPPGLPELFADWSPAELLGAAYVGEGSMLGGTVVWKLLQQNPALQPLLTPARFYQGYGPATGRYWRDFGLFLTQQAVAEPDEVVSGAQRAFKAYQVLFWATQFSAGPD